MHSLSHFKGRLFFIYLYSLHSGSRRPLIISQIIFSIWPAVARAKHSQSFHCENALISSRDGEKKTLIGSETFDGSECKSRCESDQMAAINQVAQ